METLVYQCNKGNTIGKYPPFPGLFVWIEYPVKCNVCAVNQKTVTAWFSENALISTELFIGLS